MACWFTLRWVALHLICSSIPCSASPVSTHCAPSLGSYYTLPGARRYPMHNEEWKCQGWNPTLRESITQPTDKANTRPAKNLKYSHHTKTSQHTRQWMPWLVWVKHFTMCPPQKTTQYNHSLIQKSVNIKEEKENGRSVSQHEPQLSKCKSQHLSSIF